jgi:hypothetical protein
MTMQILRQTYHPSMETRAVNSNLNAPRTQMVHSTNDSSGLSNMGMINRVRHAKSGCSSCGGSK